MARRWLFALAVACAACTTTAPEDSEEEPSPGQPNPYRLALGPFAGNQIAMVVGTSLQIEARVLTTAGQPVTPNWGPTFRTRHPGTATVDHLGLISAQAEGSTVITVEADIGLHHVQDSVRVTTACTAELEVVLSPVMQILAPGEGFTPTLTLLTCSGHVILQDTYTWTASDPTILSVAPSTGTTSALRVGSAVVRVRGVRYGLLAEITVTVE